MIDVLILAVALSMDAFAVSIGLGSQHVMKAQSLAILAAIYFGVFQALMPLIGFVGGQGILSWVEAFAHWIACFLLAVIGGKMIYESMTEAVVEGTCQISHKVLFVLALATSIDAMAAGFSLALININPFMACAIIGITTFILSWIGVYLGAQSGTYLEKKAEFIGGVILILIGFKILVF